MTVRSFRQAVGGRFVGLANFRLVLESQAFLLAVFNTLRFILVCIPVLMAFSLCIAVMIPAGKSTLMKVLFGLEAPDQGEIILKEKENVTN